MRLSKKLIKSIKESLKEGFGDGVKIYLFGSRTDDDKRGGDIDIAIDVELPKDEFRKKRVRFIISMLKKDIDLKIDLVKFRNDNTLFERQIKKSAILL